MKEQEWVDRVGVASMRRLPDVSDGAVRVALHPERAGALRTRDHAAIVYWSTEELVESVVPYLLEGLKEGDKVVYVADDLAPAAIDEALAKRGADVAREKALGRLTVLTAKDAFFAGGRFDVEAALGGVRTLAEQAAKEGFPRVRFSVEMTYLLARVPGIERGPEFESRANDEVFAQFPFVCICSFNGSRDETNLLRDVLETHPILIANGIPLANPHYKPWARLATDAEAQERWKERYGTSLLSGRG